MLSVVCATAQISPGDLSNQHANLEGLSNCTKCHELGNKASSDKCLSCHTEIQERVKQKKGYHSSSEVTVKECFSCHSEHNGKNFKLIRFDATKFNHTITGYQLSTPHAKKQCTDCHNTKNIVDQKIKSKKSSYLGLGTECLSCHADYHQKTLPTSCLSCHNPESFKPATKFNHANTKFPLVGKHKSVDCQKCHKVETVDGKKFQTFKGIQFSNCTNCHKDPHQNQFGQNCRQCHNEESFHAVKGIGNFDHSKTNFKLEEKHLAVDCKSCHKGKLTDPLKYKRCTDCHTDYHNNQFAKNGDSPDCAQCHTVKGFNSFQFTIEQHNSSPFPLRGAHLATGCNECHKKQEKWSFRDIGNYCKDCHTDIHKDKIQPKYYPDANCKVCHTENQWVDVKFDHSKTAFGLTGTHIKQSCRACHFKVDLKGDTQQKFAGTGTNCASCHTDNHFKQFEKNGVTSCNECHTTESWKPTTFNHNNAAFKLEGKHIDVPCVKCHKPQQEGTSFYTKYKLKEFKCESCHS